jgi:S-adenosylmethionine:tRNA ribosyltransferase-isomerase
MSHDQLLITGFEYTLPSDRIAQYPLDERDASRLLIMENGNIKESAFRDLPTHLKSGSLIVRNNTRVIQARLIFPRAGGSHIEIFCLEPAGQQKEMNTALQSGPGCEWTCLVGNAKKWKNGIVETVFEAGKQDLHLYAEMTGRDTGEFRIRFSWEPDSFSFAEVLAAAGRMPLPPYIKREAESSDKQRYQTVFACHEGSVAAPTAGLHFTERVLWGLSENKIETADITLHVGAGTFKPVTENQVIRHSMHPESFTAERNTLLKLIAHWPDITAVGTTSLRTLESLYCLGVMKAETHKGGSYFLDQWEAYKDERVGRVSFPAAIQNLLDCMDRTQSDQMSAVTRLMIVPGYTIKSASRLVTNFHQPGSTLLMLVAAYTGGQWRKAYDYALDQGFRFLSYGDACLFHLSPTPEKTSNGF